MKQLVKEMVKVSERGEKVTYPSIWESSDINDFRFLPSNRPINPKNVQEMLNSVLELGVLRDVVVVRCNFVNYISDGQHLEKVLELLGGLPVRFKLVEAKTEEEVYKIITKLNTTQKRFSFRNFIDGWISFRPEYGILKEYSKKYDIVDTVLVSIMTGTTINVAKQLIKSGEFKIVDIDRVTKILNSISKYSGLTTFKLERYGSEGLYEFIKGIGLEEYLRYEDKFIHLSCEYINERKITNTTFGDTKTYIKFFNEIWNRI